MDSSVILRRGGESEVVEFLEGELDRANRSSIDIDDGSTALPGSPIRKDEFPDTRYSGLLRSASVTRSPDARRDCI